MFLREAPKKTLADIREDLEKSSGNLQVIALPNPEVSVKLTGDTPGIRFNTAGEPIEVPATKEGVTAIGNWLNVPNPFLLRLDPDMQEHLLSNLLQRNRAVGNYQFNDDGLKAVLDPAGKIIDSRRLVNIAIKTIDPSAPVTDFWNNDKEFRLDAIAPEGFDRGIGGDPKVGDITRGGIRVGRDIKANLAPWVQEFLYRLACTNGMEVEDKTLRVDARGNSVDEVLAEFEALADAAFRRVENSISHFYDLRNQPVENPERTIIRLAEEHGLPARTVMSLAERAPGNDTETMFDIVNLITNHANEPSIRGRAGARRSLEQVGGTLVTQHVERCNHCQSKLN